MDGYSPTCASCIYVATAPETLPLTGDYNIQYETVSV